MILQGIQYGIKVLTGALTWYKYSRKRKHHSLWGLRNEESRSFPWRAYNDLEYPYIACMCSVFMCINCMCLLLCDTRWVCVWTKPSVCLVLSNIFCLFKCIICIFLNWLLKATGLIFIACDCSPHLGKRQHYYSQWKILIRKVTCNCFLKDILTSRFIVNV